MAWSAAAPDLSLIDAVKRRDAKSFAKIMGQRGLDINAAAPDGATALSWAVFLGLTDMAEKLLAAGASVNTAGEYGETPLTLALANADAALAAKLLKAGADAKVGRWNGETPLMIAAGSGNVDPFGYCSRTGLTSTAQNLSVGRLRSCGLRLRVTPT